jgi:hypothetical protein
MRRLALATVIAVWAAACSVARGGNLVPDVPVGALSTPAMAPGDTFTVTWTGSATHASGFLVSATATATNGTWNGLPTNRVVAAPSGTASIVTTLSAIPWDSVTLTFTVYATNGALQSASPWTGSKTVRRRPGTPTGSLDTVTVIGLLVRPDTVRFTAAGQTRQVCPFIQFATGQIAVAAGGTYHRLCDSVAVRVFTAAQRAVTVGQVLCADSGGIYCATGLGREEFRGSFQVINWFGQVAIGTATWVPRRQPVTLVIR